MMDWVTLLDEKRLKRPDAPSEAGRSPFQQDQDRIVFSAAFRRLAHKTQVHPLSDNDHVHTRLTHSVEVASVGRSLGTMVGANIAPGLDDSKITADTFGYVVQAACLAHDIGNPPFGHSGEDAIGSWFHRDGVSEKIFGQDMEDVQKNDLKYFEGNAQGFRILTQLENNLWDGGLQLTYAVLGTFSKYPRSSVIHPIPNDSYVGGRKIGFFDAEKEYFTEVAHSLGLRERNAPLHYWCRHPLAFLVEAADDICYSIVDIEDGFSLGYLNFEEAKEVLGPIARDAWLRDDMAQQEVVGKLRAVAIGELIKEVSKAFIENERALLEGTFEDEILNRTQYKENVRRAKSVAREKIYWSERKTRIEIAATEILTGLLEFYCQVVSDFEHVKWDATKLSGRSQQLARLVPNFAKGITTRYDAWLRVTDFISGMTDRYALDLYRKLKGISI
ncbi:MAG TPA: deoxyguanosinetriphosphate triphosphohydrolase [Candidatus Acidoferrales bacterium]|nr:deoxyguanosinetriphosphate triphosphohydrolase [Candidatus Acidoferrales bacterium]